MVFDKLGHEGVTVNNWGHWSGVEYLDQFNV
jgi:hypothetical protein